MPYAALTSEPLSRSRRFSTSVAIPAALTVLVIGVVVAAVAVWSAGRADQISVEKQQRIVRMLLDKEIVEIAHQQESSTVWDDAVVHLKGPLDPDWIDANVGVWMNMYFGHDRTFVLDDHDRPIYASNGPDRSTPDDYRLIAASAAPLIARLRAVLGSGGWKSDDPHNRSPGAEDLSVIDGHPAILSVKPVMPWGSTLKQEPGTEYLHISVRYLDGTFKGDLLDRFAFDGLRFSRVLDRKPGERSTPLRDARGRDLGFFIWTPDRPGRAMLKDLALALTLAILAIGTVVGLLVFQLRRGARALQAGEALARHLALHDPLTGLPNRALFNSRLAGMIGAGRSFVLLLVDLDRFKAVNDGFGHAAGDAVLREVGERFGRVLGPEATLARIGGDEFAVLLPGADGRAGIETLGGALVDAATKPFTVPGGLASIGASIGAAVWPRDGADAETLCRRADQALYRIKNDGRAGIGFAQDLAGENRLDRAA